MSPVRFLFSLSLYSSTGNICKKNSVCRVTQCVLRSLKSSQQEISYDVNIRVTWVSGQVLEVHRLTDLAVRGPAELHLDSNGLGEVSVAVGRCAEHNGHLSVDISLGERALPLPGVLEETHLDVLCRGADSGKYEEILKLRVDSPGYWSHRGFFLFSFTARHAVSFTVNREQELMQCYITFAATQHTVWQHLASLIISFSCQTWRKKGVMFKAKMWQLCLQWKCLYDNLLKRWGPRVLSSSPRFRIPGLFFSTLM